MAQTWTLSGNLKDLLGSTAGLDFTRLAVWVAPTTDAPLVAKDTGEIRVGKFEPTVAADGSVSFVGLPDTSITGSNGWKPAPFRYRLIVRYRDNTTLAPLQTWESSEFELTNNTTLGAVLNELPPGVSEGLVALFAQYADTAQTSAADAQSAQSAAEAARDDALAHTEPLTAPANSQVASYVVNDGATKTALSASYGPGSPRYAIVALGGQSNMQGPSTAPTDPLIDTVDPRLRRFTLNASAGATAGVVAQAVDPMPHRLAAAGMGPGIPFARWYQGMIPTAEIPLLIPAAQGQTGFSDGAWGPTGPCYLDMVASIDAAIALGGHLTIVLWSQVERDIDDNANPATYRTNVDQMESNLRARYGDEFLFLTAAPSREFVYIKGANAQALADVVADTPRRKVRSAYVPAEYGWSDPSDSYVHFTAAGQRARGDGYALAVARARANVPDIAPLTPAAPKLKQGGTTVTATWAGIVSRVSSYGVRYRVNGGSWNTVTRTDDVRPEQAIAGQTVGTAVEVQVNATNETGTSAWSTSGSLTLVTGTSSTPNLVLSATLSSPAMSSAFFMGSVARRVVVGYTGPLCRVRRTSDNTEADLAQASNGSLNETAAVAFANGSDLYITRLYKQNGGGGADVVQATAANQPRLAVGGVLTKVNGKVAADQSMDAARLLQNTTPGITNAGAASLWAVMRCGAGAAGAGGLVSENSNTTSFGYFPGQVNGNGDNLQFVFTNDAGATLVSANEPAPTAFKTGYHLLGIVDTGSSIAYRHDGAQAGASAAYTRSGTFTANRFSIFGSRDAGLHGIPSLWSEILVFADDLAPADITALEGNVSAFYSTAP